MEVAPQRPSSSAAAAAVTVVVALVPAATFDPRPVVASGLALVHSTTFIGFRCAFPLRYRFFRLFGLQMLDWLIFCTVRTQYHNSAGMLHLLLKPANFLSAFEKEL